MIAPAFPDQPFQARLTQVGPRVDWDRGVVGVRLKPDTLPAFVLPNMTVDVNVEVGRYTQVTTLPPSAVLRPRDGTFALAVRGNRFERVTLTVLGENPTAIAVTGIAGSDRVALQATRVVADRSYRLVDSP